MPRDSTVSMSDVAAACGVSPMTVSYTLSRPERVAATTRERVLAEIERSGYAGPDPRARSLRLQRSDCVGVVLGEHLRYAFEDPMAARFLAGVSDELVDGAQTLAIIPTTGADSDGRRVARAAVDAFVFWTTSSDDPALGAALATGRRVVVHAGGRVPGTLRVGIDDRAAARAVGLIGLRRAHRPAVLSFPFSASRQASASKGIRPNAATMPVTRARLRGFADACAELDLRANLVPVHAAARNDLASASEAASALLATSPDAVLTMSDVLASAVLDEAESRGLEVPDDLAVTGWDDGPAGTDLNLTTVAQDLRAQGAACARLALGHDDVVTAAEWRVVERDSTRR